MPRFLLQKLNYQGQDIAPDFIKSSTLIYKVNSLAPRLILRLKNPHNVFEEDFNLKTHGVFLVELSDELNENEQGESNEFVITDIHQDGNANVLKVECLEKEAYELSKNSCDIFNKQSVSSVLSGLSNFKQEISLFPVNNTYHVGGKRKIGTIARMARELGAIFYIRENKLFFLKKADILKEKDIAEFEYRNTQAEYRIFTPKIIDEDFLYNDSKKCVLGFDPYKGIIRSTKNNKSLKRQFVECDTVLRLNNLSEKILRQAIRFSTIGDFSLKIGNTVKLLWHSDVAERPINESYPDRIIITELAFHEESNFLCYITGSV